jgi:hypothetical protein
MTKATETWKLIEPYAQRMMDDILGVGARRGSVGEYPLLLYDGDEIIDFPYSAAGMTAAISASASGDTIFQFAGTISGNYTNKAGVTILGQGKNSILSGTITNDGILNNVNLSVYPATASSGLFISVIVDTGNIINGTSLDISNASGSTTNYNTMGGGTESNIDTGGTHGPNTTDYNVIFGGRGQYIQSAAYGVICGGRSNEIFGNYSFIGGGYDNATYDENDYSAIIGGQDNVIGGQAGKLSGKGWNFVGAGQFNLIDDGIYCGIAAGYTNAIDGDGSETDSVFIGGGYGNTISGNCDYSSILGGEDNVITAATNGVITGGRLNDIKTGADYAFATGRRAQVAHQGAMLFADSTDADFDSAAANEFAVRATGGFRFIGSVQINPGLSDYDTIISGDTEANLFRVDAGLDAVHIGDWDTNYVSVDKAGDVVFVGGAGIQFGEIYVEGIDFDILLAEQDVYVQCLPWSDGAGVDGNSNGCTPDVTNDHITVAVDGMYYIRWHVSCYAANKNEYEFEICVNDGPINGTAMPNTEAYRTTSVAAAVGAMSGGGICDLAADDTVELWVERKDGGDPDKTLTIRQATISLMQIGGT